MAIRENDLISLNDERVKLYFNSQSGAFQIIVDGVVMSDSSTGTSAADLERLDVTTEGTGEASKVLTLDANGDARMPLSGILGLSRVVLAAAGANQAAAAVIVNQVTVVTGADAAVGVALPAAAIADGPYFIVNAGTADLLVYPVASGNDAINAIASNSPYTLAAGRGVWFTPTSATQWYAPYETRSIQFIIPASENAKLAGSGAGWVLAADDALHLLTLPASQTAEVVAVGIPGLLVGDIVTGVAVVGQVESAGGTVTITMDVRKHTAAAADVSDASLSTDNLGAGVTADTILSATNLGVTGLTETMAADEMLYVNITATTAGSTDIAIMGLLVTVTRRNQG